MSFMSRHFALTFTLTTVLCSAASSDAQVVADGNEWARATALGIFGGGASSSSQTGPALGGVMTWEVDPRLAVEGRGTWLHRGPGSEAFGADIGALVNVISRRSVTPYVGAAFGLYRTWFDSIASDMPESYRRRAMNANGSVTNVRLAFTDPAFRLASGVEVIVHRRFTIRPEASVLWTWGDRSHDTIVVFGARVGYRFGDYPITPARGE